MKNQLVMLAAILAVSCNDATTGQRWPDIPPIPDPHPATVPGLYGEELNMTVSYEDGHPDPHWDAWAGYGTIALFPPDAGSADLLADIVFQSGFDLLVVDCWGSGQGVWTYDPASGAFTFDAALGDEFHPTMLHVEGSIMVHYDREIGEAGTVTDTPRLVASGTWNVTLHPACESDSFPGGTSGVWTNFEGFEAMQVDPVQGGDGDALGELLGVVVEEYETENECGQPMTVTVTTEIRGEIQ